MRRELLVIHFVLSLLITCEAQTTSIVDKVDRWYWYSREMRETMMSESERREVIQELRRRLPLGDQTDQGRYRYLLLRLSDEQTMVEVMAEIRSEDQSRQDNAWATLANVNTPLLIPHVAEFLHATEEARMWSSPGSDVIRYTRSLAAAEKIQDILLSFSGFSQDVRQWVGSVDRVDAEAFRATMRKWWEQNKEAFARKDYAAVKPLQPVALPAPSIAPKQTSQPSVSPAKIEAPAKPPLASAPAAQSKSSSVPFPLLIGIGAVALVAIVAVLIWQGRRQKAE